VHTSGKHIRNNHNIWYASGGTYIIWYTLDAALELTPGRLGAHLLPAGHCAYVGSAFGPGGLAARLKHHCRRSDRLHCHIDYLGRCSRPHTAWVCRQAVAWEHVWADVLAGMRGAQRPIPGFGSSDCRCPAHLVGFRKIPAVNTFRRRWRRAYAKTGPMAVLYLSQKGFSRQPG